MKQLLIALLTLCCWGLGADYATAKSAETLKSPDGRLVLTAGVKDGKAWYQLQRGSEMVMFSHSS